MFYSDSYQSQKDPIISARQAFGKIRSVPQFLYTSCIRKVFLSGTYCLFISLKSYIKLVFQYEGDHDVNA